MKPMLLHHCLLVSAGLALSGCGKSQPAAPATTPPPLSPPAQAMPSLSGGAPPPPPSGSVSGVAATTTPGDKTAPAAPTELSTFPLEDDDGKPLTDAVQILQRAVEVYDDQRSDDEEKPWPELTDLSLLTKYKILNRLPPAPQGKKFVFNPKTKQVALVPQ